MRVPALLLILLAAGCGQSAPAQNAAVQPSPPSPAASTSVLTITGSGEFKPGSTTAVVYDSKLVPDGAQASASAESSGTTTLSSVVVEGFLPGRTYGVHLHVDPCGAKPEDSGAHFQHLPAHADAGNEVWLDLTTDSSGNGTSSARQSWAFTRDHLPRSVVFHAQPTTSTGPNAGMAGPRAACLTLTAR